MVTAQYKLAENADMAGVGMMSMPLVVEPMAAGITVNDITVNLHIYLGNKNHVKDTLLNDTFTIKDITNTEREDFEGLKGKDLLEYLNNFTSVDLSPYIALSNGLYYEMSFRPQTLVPGVLYEVNVHLKTNIAVNTHHIIFMVDDQVYDRIEDVPYGADLTGYLIAEPTKTGYTFSGWSELPATMPDEDVTVSGTFTVNTHDIIYKVDGVEYDTTEDVPYGADLTGYLIAEPTKTGYTFSGWSELPATMPDEDVTVSGTFTVNTHDIIYKVDGVEYDTTENVPYGADLTGYLIAEPTKAGHTFSGWTGLPATMPDEDVTVSGTFTMNTYTVRFFAADGVTQIGAAQTIPWGAAATLVTPPAITGFTFDTWRLTGDDDAVATSLSDVRENIDTFRLTMCRATSQ